MADTCLFYMRVRCQLVSAGRRYEDGVAPVQGRGGHREFIYHNYSEDDNIPSSYWIR